MLKTLKWNWSDIIKLGKPCCSCHIGMTNDCNNGSHLLHVRPFICAPHIKNHHILMAKLKTAVTPLLRHWSCWSLTLKQSIFVATFLPVLPQGVVPCIQYILYIGIPFNPMPAYKVNWVACYWRVTVTVTINCLANTKIVAPFQHKKTSLHV